MVVESPVTMYGEETTILFTKRGMLLLLKKKPQAFERVASFFEPEHPVVRSPIGKKRRASK
jgi:hypothetical protein